MKISRSFPSKWLKATDIPKGKKVICRIREVTTEDIGDEEKIVLYFQGKDKGMMLNRTNAGILAMAYGDETDDWIGKEMYIYVHMVRFKGQLTPGLAIDTPREVASFEEPPAKQERRERMRQVAEGMEEIGQPVRHAPMTPIADTDDTDLPF